MNIGGLNMSIKTSKYLWFFSGFWVLLGGIVSAAALLGGTVGDFLGLKDLLINLPLYDLAVIYRSNSSLVHILSLLFLVSWSLQGYFTFLMQSKNISELFVGVNIIQLPVWLYSFWDLIDPVLATVKILIVNNCMKSNNGSFSHIQNFKSFKNNLRS